MAEMATVAVRAVVAGEHHAADLCFIAWMPDHRTEFFYAVSKLAVLTVAAGAHGNALWNRDLLLIPSFEPVLLYDSRRWPDVRRGGSDSDTEVTEIGEKTVLYSRLREETQTLDQIGVCETDRLVLLAKSIDFL
nr:hypothetical protein Iba_chr05dCG3200 [Ipomoea batatas]